MNRTPTKKRERILAMLNDGRTYAEIQKEVGCGAGLITRVKKEAGQAVQKRSAPEQPETGSDGLSEFIPPDDAKRSGAHQKRSTPAPVPAPDGGAAQSEVYACGSCGVKWTLDPGEEHVKECPAGCGARYA